MTDGGGWELEWPRVKSTDRVHLEMKNVTKSLKQSQWIFRTLYLTIRGGGQRLSVKTQPQTVNRKDNLRVSYKYNDHSSGVKLLITEGLSFSFFFFGSIMKKDSRRLSPSTHLPLSFFLFHYEVITDHEKLKITSYDSRLQMTPTPAYVIVR